jgi:hypothetical protein
MVPVELPPSGLAKLSGIAPSALPAAPRARGEFAVPGKAGACVELGGVAGASVELGGVVTLGVGAIWAKPVPQPSEKIAAAVRNKWRICFSYAISD